jgi:uncharacterized repeat protein (TIGR02543 family)
VTLDAQWTENTVVKVSFNSEGGSAVNSINGPVGSTFSLPAAPVRSGYTFNGWFIAASGGSALTSPYTITGTATLDAQWNALPKALTTTALSKTRSTVTYGDEGDEGFVATVTGVNNTLPTGTMTFKAGSTTLCTTSFLSRLNATTVFATCGLANSQLVVGSYSVSADYSGDGHYASSISSPAQSLSVVKDSTYLSVSVSPSTVAFGDESNARITVTVLTGNGEALIGPESVTVTVGTTDCVALVSPSRNGGIGTCSITNSALLKSTRSYSVSAAYVGDVDLTGSTATARSGLTVT